MWKPTILAKESKGSRPPMTDRIPKLAILFASALAASAVSGCASINESLSAAMADTMPRWAGGLPPDAPPRPGTAKYDEFMRERERQRLMPAAEREREQQAEQQAKSDQAGLDPVH
jgi:hypothetical protein